LLAGLTLPACGCLLLLLLQVAALRALAVLGKNELVQQAAGKPAIQGRGLRILSMGGCRSHLSTACCMTSWQCPWH
jgi:hypothetical protein